MQSIKGPVEAKLLDYREKTESDDEEESKSAQSVTTIESDELIQPDQPPLKKEVVVVPARYPSASEIVQRKEDIEYDVDSLAQLETRLEEKRLEIIEMEKLREELKARIFLKRWAISKLRSFPDELLSVIFELYMQCGENMDPWLLMQICRQWRSAAVHTRRLWSKIMLGSYKCDPKVRRYKGYEVCHSPKLLRSAISRTAKGPIDMMFEFYPYCKRSDDDEVKTRALASLQELVDVLQETKCYARIRTLEVNQAWDNIVLGLNFQGLNFRVLKQATLYSSFPTVLQGIQTTAQRLKVLRIQGSSNMRLEWDLSQLASLRELDLSASALTGQEALRAIRTAPRLVELTLRGIDLPRFTHEPLRISTLLTLHLRASTIQCDVDLCHLQTLRLVRSKISTGRTDLLFLQALKYLEIDGVKAEESPRIRAREISTLEIGWYDTKRAEAAKLLERLMEQLIQPGLLVPQAIHLRDGSLEPKFLVTWLNKMPFLTELHFGSRFPLSKQFFDALAGGKLPLKAPTRPKASSKPSVPLCPALESFNLTIGGLNSSTETAMVKWSAEAARARCKGQFPIKEAFIQDSYDSPWRNLL